MNIELDLHVHTIASGHAYSTLYENVQEAKRKGLKVLGMTDHGPNMPGGPHIFHFGNLRALPSSIEGIRILRGCEANILNFEGELDIPLSLQKRMEVMIASLHDVCLLPGNANENTKALLKVMDNPYVDILGHPGNPAFPIDEEAVVKKAKEKNILIELNNGSFRSRKGSKDNCLKIAKLCVLHKVPVILGSDSHFFTQIADYSLIEEVLKKAEVPEELIMNYKSKELLEMLKCKGKISK